MYKEGFGNIANKDKVISYLENVPCEFKGPWIIHTYLLGGFAKNIAKDLGLDADVAFACGALAYLGKSRVKDGSYIVETYRILRLDSYFYESRLAIKFAFYKNDLESFLNFSDLSKDDQVFVGKFLNKYDPDAYSELIYFLDKYLLKVCKSKYGKSLVDASVYRIDDKNLDRIYKYYQSQLPKPIASYIPKLKKSKFPLNLFTSKPIIWL